MLFWMSHLLFMMALCACASTPRNITRIPASDEAAPGEPILMAITMDDLPVYDDNLRGVNRLEIAQKILQTFKDNQVPEVYGFVNGFWLSENPGLGKILKLWTDAGYPLGNHTYNHLDLDSAHVSAARYIADIDRNESILEKYSAGKDWHFFRYPFLDEGSQQTKQAAVRNHLLDHQYKIAKVTMDFQDWNLSDALGRCENTHNQEAVKFVKQYYMAAAEAAFTNAVKESQALFHRQIPQVLLLHIGSIEAEMLPSLLAYLQQQGVKFISLSEALSDQAYTDEPRQPYPGGGDYFEQYMAAHQLSHEKIGVAEPSPAGADKIISNLCVPHRLH